MNQAIAFVHEQLTQVKDFPKFKAGDNVTVNYKIIEGNYELKELKSADEIFITNSSIKLLFVDEIDQILKNKKG